MPSKVGVDDFLASGHTVDDLVKLAVDDVRPSVDGGDGGPQDAPPPSEPAVFAQPHDSNPGTPEVERDGPDFTFSWRDAAIRLEVTHAREDGEKFTVEADVSHAGTQLHHETLNINAGKTVAGFASALSKKYAYLADYWHDMAMRSFDVVRRDSRTLPPPVDLDSLPVPKARDVYYDNFGLAVREEPTAFYGAGDRGKSLIAMGYSIAVAGGVDMAHITPWRTGPVVWCDFEDRPWVAALRKRAWCAGLGLDPAKVPFIYMNLKGYDLENVRRDLRRVVRQEGAILAVVDSYIAAAGRDPEKSDTARRYHANLAYLGIATITITHTTRAETDDPNAKTFGSVVFPNYCRNSWLFLRGQDQGDNVAVEEYVLTALHKKRNLGTRPDMALRVRLELEEGVARKIVAVRSDVFQDDPDLARASKTGSGEQRVRAAIEDGCHAPAKIAKYAGLSRQYAGMVCLRMTKAGKLRKLTDEKGSPWYDFMDPDNADDNNA